MVFVNILVVYAFVSGPLCNCTVKFIKRLGRSSSCHSFLDEPSPGFEANLAYYYYWYSALGPVWAETRVQSGDWYGSGTLRPGQVLRGSLPLLSPAF